MIRTSTLSMTGFVMRGGGCASHPGGFVSRAVPTGAGFARVVPGRGTPFSSREPHDFQEQGKARSPRESGSRLAVAVSLRFSLPIGGRRSCIPEWTCRLLSHGNPRRTRRPVPASRQAYLAGCNHWNRTGWRMTACSPQAGQRRLPHHYIEFRKLRTTATASWRNRAACSSSPASERNAPYARGPS